MKNSTRDTAPTVWKKQTGISYCKDDILDRPSAASQPMFFLQNRIVYFPTTVHFTIQ
jgi:hypothetical protein